MQAHEYAAEHEQGAARMGERPLAVHPLECSLGGYAALRFTSASPRAESF